MGCTRAWRAGRSVAAGIAIALAAAGCGATQAPTLKRVIAAMGAERRMVVTLTGGGVRRVVIDTTAQYRAVFASRMLLLLERDGVEYRPANGCYAVATGGRLRTDSLWAGTLDDVASTKYSTLVSGASVVYTSSVGELTVDARTDLVQSARLAGSRPSGVAATSAAFTYPASVRELPVPTRLCQ